MINNLDILTLRYIREIEKPSEQTIALTVREARLDQAKLNSLSARPATRARREA